MLYKCLWNASRKNLVYLKQKTVDIIQLVLADRGDKILRTGRSEPRNVPLSYDKI